MRAVCVRERERDRERDVHINKNWILFKFIWLFSLGIHKIMRRRQRRQRIMNSHNVRQTNFVWKSIAETESSSVEIFAKNKIRSSSKFICRYLDMDCVFMLEVVKLRRKMEPHVTFVHCNYIHTMKMTDQCGWPHNKFTGRFVLI